MKAIIKTLFFSTLLMSLWGCHLGDKDPQRSFSMDTKIYLMSSNSASSTCSGRVYVLLKNIDASEMELTSDQTWCTVEAQRLPPVGRSTVYGLLAEPNTTAFTRSCTLTLTRKTTGERTTATLIQPVSYLHVDIPSAGGPYSISKLLGIENADVTYPPAAQGKYEFLKISANNRIEFEPNLSNQPRTQEVTLSVAASDYISYYTFLVNQLAGTGLIATPNSFTFTSAGGTQYGSVNIADWWYDSYMTISTWCTIQRETDDRLSVTIEPNLTGAQRTGEVTLFIKDSSGKRVTTKVTITQN
ncbi:MAG: BACON domain-containing protein [Mucinivorans sp.]